MLVKDKDSTPISFPPYLTRYQSEKTMSKERLIQTTITRHKTFWIIANERHDFLAGRAVERQARRVKTDRDVDFVCWKNAEIQRAAMISVVFCALTLEAFINNYGILSFSKNFFDTHLDRLSPVTKWTIIPQLKTGQCLDPHGTTIRRLASLFKRRDKLVHHKTVTKPVSDAFNQDWLTEKDSEEAISTVRRLVKELAEIDNSIDTSWLEIDDRDIYA